MLIKLDKSVITAFDYLARRELDTNEILTLGNPLSSCACGGASHTWESARSWSRAGSAVRFRPAWRRSPSEKDHVFSAARELV